MNQPSAHHKLIIRTSLLLALVMCAMAASARDFHRHGEFRHGGGHGRSHFNFGLYWGMPLFWGLAPYYFDRRPLYVQPPIYIEQSPPRYTQQLAPVWYYCQSPAGYYPYVQQCGLAWLAVDPRTVPPR